MNFKGLGGIVKTISSGKKCTAENAIYAASSNRLRPLEVEQMYMTVRYKFKVNLQNKQLRRCTVKQIRMYLEDRVKLYYHTSFKNDAHAIYTMLKAKDITVQHLQYVNSLVGGIRTVD